MARPILSVWVPGKPRAYQRSPKGFVSKTVARHEKTLRDYLWHEAMGQKEHFGLRLPIEKPIRMEVKFGFQGRFGWTGIDIYGDMDFEPYEMIPDIDNCLKLVMEATQHAGIVKDDALVCEVLVSKRR